MLVLFMAFLDAFQKHIVLILRLVHTNLKVDFIHYWMIIKYTLVLNLRGVSITYSTSVSSQVPAPEVATASTNVILLEFSNTTTFCFASTLIRPH